MAGYYKTIDGVKMDAALLECADECIAGRGDGRISQADAETLLERVKDGNSYTDIEKATVKYIRENYKWTDEADAWFRKEINMWNLQGHK
jgi:hypothetical protein